ncbi:aspartate ammonia-lyase, partial [Candidatus Peregrinibacteria bacterium]|nr:aspartate ammonia-lyase [Candidatus Peregrinibacteria bacterium]
MKSTRTEKDSLGPVKVPQDAYFGAQTSRALKNFQISNRHIDRIFMESLGMIKLSAAKTNFQLRLLNSQQYRAIRTAAKEFINGNFSSDFILDAYQAGAGTSYNMNANEIIANRANEILRFPESTKGNYKFVHPNDHVNMGQSTNDVIPTVSRLAILFSLPALLNAIKSLENRLADLAKKHKNLVKVGRTHLQDAVPITFGGEIDSFRAALENSRRFIEEQSTKLQIIGIGGTAVGTGLNAHPRYRQLMLKNLTKLTGIHFTSARNLTESANNMNPFMNFSASLRSLATDLLNLSANLKLMNSGPISGLGEITLPPVQPGSSIMPGKVNPSILECLEMICLQVLGYDKVIEMACQRSNFELNTNCPLIIHNLLEAIKILTNGINMTTSLAIKNLKVNEKKIRETFENSLCTATELAPRLGYQLTAEIVKSA